MGDWGQVQIGVERDGGDFVALFTVFPPAFVLHFEAIVVPDLAGVETPLHVSHRLVSSTNYPILVTRSKSSDPGITRWRNLGAEQLALAGFFFLRVALRADDVDQGHLRLEVHGLLVLVEHIDFDPLHRPYDELIEVCLHCEIKLKL